jgi:hypothetical protein
MAQPQQPMSGRQLETVRRRYAVILRRAGLTYAQIAASLGPDGPLYADRTTACRAVSRVRPHELEPGDHTLVGCPTLDPNPGPQPSRLAHSIAPERPGWGHLALSHHPGRVAGGATYLRHLIFQTAEVGPLTSVIVGPANADTANMVRFFFE